jgi:hypothetical protein
MLPTWTILADGENVLKPRHQVGKDSNCREDKGMNVGEDGRESRVSVPDPADDSHYIRQQPGDQALRILSLTTTRPD